MIHFKVLKVSARKDKRFVEGLWNYKVVLQRWDRAWWHEKVISEETWVSQTGIIWSREGDGASSLRDHDLNKTLDDVRQAVEYGALPDAEYI